ncbi:hypothetical protein DSO57_1036654 [Entomophthora muscae]|uniref:Uncharacterized protein n=3 Tax=Entomophthora muscae TaxID=34485 RepID=A0ACC2UJ29_9FUNG|nr:hypothetical protein DSO57_1039004 [Entomophthora muscae]KAJ9079265.1 hypothetical protein DSO57_1037221 [Entomophthora muscae]KAJ9087100.1 hypothetical protein DSO57_1036654 [Entomophthora muscae]
MKFYTLALISAVACATTPNVTTPAPAGAKSNASSIAAPTPAGAKSNTNTSDSNLPSLSPSAVKATKLTTVELSLPWESPCSAKETPSCKISIDADAIKAGASISASAVDGIEVKGFKGDKETKISGKSDKDVKKDKLTSVVLTFKKDVAKGTMKTNILYFAQKAGRNKTMDTFFEIELKCGTTPVKSYKKTDKSAPILKVSSATSATLAFAASFTFLSTLYLYI